jgi:predicted permease
LARRPAKRRDRCLARGAARPGFALVVLLTLALLLELTMQAIVNEVRRAARTLRRMPAFTLVVLAVLGLGIGANAAIFGVVRGVLMKPLALPAPDRVVALWSTNAARGETRGGVSRQDADDWRRDSHSFVAMGTYTSLEGNAVVRGEPERVKVALATSGVFRALGVRPELGRVLDDADERPGDLRVAVISHDFWVRAFARSTTTIGATMNLDGKPLTIVGVMPAGFDFPDAATAVLRPFGAPPDATGPRIARWVAAVARLRPEATIRQARVEMTTIAERLAREYPASNRDVGVLVEPLLSSETGSVRALLFVAWGMTLLLLLVVTATTANLFLARSVEREGEMAVRASLGATGAALVRQTLSESMLLAGVGALLGAALAVALWPLVREFAATHFPRAGHLAIDGWVLGCAFGSSLFIGVGFGLIPAIGAARTPPASVLRGTGRTSASRARERLRGGLVVAQVAFAAIVLIGAGLLFRSFRQLAGVEPGFGLGDRVTFRVAPSQAVMRSRAEGAAFYAELMSRLAALPGVRSVSAVNRLPLTGSWWTTEFRPEGRSFEAGREPTASYRVVLPRYFSTMGIPLVSGRALDADDEQGQSDVVVVSRSFAARAWPGMDPVGQRVTFDPQRPTAPWYTVVGVVGDVHTSGLSTAPEPLAYVPFSRARFGHFGDWGMDVVVQGSPGMMPNAMLDASRGALRAFAPSLPLFLARPLAALVSADLAQAQALVVLIGTLALVAALLSALGVYGVVAHGVTRRRAELGLRVALGAETSSVVRMVLWRGMAFGIAGSLIGAGAAALSSRVLGRLLYGIGPLDPATFALVPALLVLVTVVAAGVPAMRAARIDPMDVMRAE